MIRETQWSPTCQFMFKMPAVAQTGMLKSGAWNSGQVSNVTVKCSRTWTSHAISRVRCLPRSINRETLWEAQQTDLNQLSWDAGVIPDSLTLCQSTSSIRQICVQASQLSITNNMILGKWLNLCEAQFHLQNNGIVAMSLHGGANKWK